jgi:hypothetical protein
VTEVRAATESTQRTEGTSEARRSGPGPAIAWVAWLLALVGGLVGFAMAARAATTPGGYPQDPLTSLSTMAAILSYGSVGLILRLRRPDHTMGWLFLAIALTAAASNLSWGTMAMQSEQPTTDRLWLVGALVYSAALLVTWFLLLAGLILCFPTGRPAGLQERRLLWGAILLAPVLAIGVLLRPGPIIAQPAFENPIVEPGGLGAVVLPAAFLCEIALAVLGILAMARRYRDGGSELRHQIRWFALGAVALVAASGLYLGVGILVPAAEIVIWNLVYVTWALSLVVLPVAVLFAITRHRLYEIDRIIGRTFVIGSMAAILAGLFAASMRLLEALVVAVTGERSDVIVVVTTLILTTTFTPLKQWLEKIPPRWFKDDPESSLSVNQAVVVPAPTDGTSTASADEELDARIERIARRVSEEVVASATLPGSGGPPEPR